MNIVNSNGFEQTFLGFCQAIDLSDVLLESALSGRHGGTSNIAREGDLAELLKPVEMEILVALVGILRQVVA